MSNLITTPHPVLFFTPRVVEFNQELSDLAERMKQTCEEENMQSLSAPQIGSNTNIILVNGELYINPRIIQGENELSSSEVCPTFKHSLLAFTRFSDLHLYYQTLSGEEKLTWITDRPLAIEIQHQIGHVQGDTQLGGVGKVIDPPTPPAPYSLLIPNPSACRTCGPSRWKPKRQGT